MDEANVEITDGKGIQKKRVNEQMQERGNGKEERGLGKKIRKK
jgi:hypothetical protein